MRPEEAKHPKGLPAELPMKGTRERCALATVVRSRFEALKYVKEYVQAWDAVESTYGRPRVLAALRQLRAALPIPDADDEVVLSLANLAPTSRVGPLGPVDPHDPEDPRDLDGLLEAVDDICAPNPFWFLEVLGIRADWPPVAGGDGWAHADINLTQNKTVLKLALDVLWEAGRAELGIEKSSRVLGRRNWEDERGPRDAFRLYGAVRENPAPSHRDHAKSVLSGEYTTEYLDKTASELLAQAKALVNEERRHYLRERQMKQMQVSKLLSPEGPDKERLAEFIGFLREHADLTELLFGYKP